MKKYLIIGGVVGLLIWFNSNLLPFDLVGGLVGLLVYLLTGTTFITWPAIEAISYILSGVLYAYIIYYLIIDCLKRKNILIPSLILNALFIILALSYIFTPFLDWAILQKSFPRVCDYVKVHDPDSYNADDNNYFAKTCDQWNGTEPNSIPE